jgi:hypothetical protein
VVVLQEGKASRGARKAQSVAQSSETTGYSVYGYYYAPAGRRQAAAVRHALGFLQPASHKAKRAAGQR